MENYHVYPSLIEWINPLIIFLLEKVQSHEIIQTRENVARNLNSSNDEIKIEKQKFVYKVTRLCFTTRKLKI